MSLFKRTTHWSSLTKDEWGRAAQVVNRRAATLRQSIPYTTNPNTREAAEDDLRLLEQTAALLAAHAGVQLVVPDLTLRTTGEVACTSAAD
jgi:hypothetical protein